MSTALQINPKERALRTLIDTDGAREQFAKLLGKTITPDRFLRVVFTAVQKTPALLDCDQSSLMVALLDSARCKLEPDGKRAALVPFKGKVQFIPMYPGLIELARRGGKVGRIYAHCVYDGDDFDFEYGANPQLRHKPARGPRHPDNVVAAYAVAHLKDGVDFEVMYRDEIDAIRARSPAGRSGPWVTDFGEQARKTPLRRLCKRLPMDPEALEVVMDDERWDTMAQAEVVDHPDGPPDSLDALAGRLAGPAAKEEPEAPEEPEPQEEAAQEPPQDVDGVPAPWPIGDTGGKWDDWCEEKVGVSTMSSLTWNELRMASSKDLLQKLEIAEATGRRAFAKGAAPGSATPRWWARMGVVLWLRAQTAAGPGF